MEGILQGWKESFRSGNTYTVSQKMRVEMVTKLLSKPTIETFVSKDEYILEAINHVRK